MPRPSDAEATSEDVSDGEAAAMGAGAGCAGCVGCAVLFWKPILILLVVAALLKFIFG